MWLKSLSILMLISLGIAQEEIEETGQRGARLRLRRPRPIGISNPDGIAEGRPIPLRRIPQGIPIDQLVNQRQSSADLLAQTLTGGSDGNDNDLRGQSLQGTDALQNLLATAAEGEDIIEYDDIIEEEPVRPQRPQRPSGGRTRLPPGIPRSSNKDNEKKGQRIPNRPKAENVDTVERYSHTNEDGSFTFGYIGEDGSFREETRGVDCITRGKYGYIDPDGKKREFTYVSGLPCDITDEDNAGTITDDEDSLQREDPIAPNDRFRTSDPIQLADDEIPQSARPRQRQPSRPAQDFSSFAPEQPIQRPAPATRVRDPALNNRRPRPGQQNTGALQSLLNIANGDQAQQQALPPTRAPQPAVTRPASPPRTPRPTAARPSVFDFDSAVDDFTLNKPALTFDDEPKKPASPTGPNFSTELVFDPASGTFKTELRQALPNGEEIRTSDDAAPSGAAKPTERPATPTPSALPPTPRPFTAFSPTTLGPRPTQPASPTAFEPLTFPSPAPTTPRPAPASPVTTAAPVRTTARPAPPASPVPTSAQPASPTPAGSFFFQPFPTLGSPRPLNVAQGSPSPAPAASPAPSATPSTQARPFTTFNTGNGAFISFGAPSRPVAQPQPVAAPQQPRAPQPPQPTQPRPVQTTAGVPFGAQPFSPRPVQPQVQQFGQPFTVFGNPTLRPQPTPQAVARPTPGAPEAPRQSASPSPAPASPAPASPRPSPTPAPAPRPSPTPQVVASAPTPQVQFGFQPIQQSSQVPSRPGPPQPQNRPFTAFASGPPPQLNGANPQFSARPPTTFFGQPQRPAQPQPQRPQQLGIPPQLQNGPPQGGRFQPFNRPPPQQQSRPSPFTVFNPAALVGARFF